MMDDPAAAGQDRDARTGLCARCAHVEVVVSHRGSRFYLCRLSYSDPRFARYPPLPGLACAGFVERRDP